MVALKNKKQEAPKPPSALPWFTIGCLTLMGGGYALFEGWAWTGWILLGISPLVMAILPMEIREFRRRRQICDHIRSDFTDEKSSSVDHTAFLNALHQERQRPTRHSPFSTTTT